MESTTLERHGGDYAPESTKHYDGAQRAPPMARQPRRPLRSEDSVVYIAERKASEPRKEYQRIDDFNDSREPSRSAFTERGDVLDGPAELEDSSSPTPTAEDFPKPPPKYSLSPYPPPCAPLPKLPAGIKSSEGEDRSEMLKELIWHLLWGKPSKESVLKTKDKYLREVTLHTVAVLLTTSPGTSSDHAAMELLKICSVPSARKRTEVELGLSLLTQPL